MLFCFLADRSPEEKKMAFMLIYVDDIKLVAKSWLHKNSWSKWSAVIDMGEEEAEGSILGCKYTK